MFGMSNANRCHLPYLSLCWLAHLLSSGDGVALAYRTSNFSVTPHQVLIQLCQRMLPGLEAEEGSLSRGLHVSGRDNQRLLENLLKALEQQYPEAGRHYWSMRSWGLLIWQPVMLTLLTTEILQQQVNLQSLGQHCAGTLVAGMTLGPELLISAPSRRDLAATHLRAVCDQALDELGRVIQVNPVLARRLLADRILSTLLRMRPLLADRSHASVCGLASSWLEQAGLKGGSALMTFGLPQGGEELALDRKGCCQHYRRSDGGLCKTCPRQPKHIRIKRLQEEWSQDARAE